MIERYVLVAVVYFLYIIIYISIPVKRNAMKKDSGSCLLSFSKPITVRHIAILVVSVLLIPIVLFFTYRFFVLLVFAACGVMGSYMSAKEITYGPYYGVYQMGFCADGAYISFDDISSIKDSENIAEINVSKVTLKNNRVKAIYFSSESEKNVVISKLKEMKVI